MDQKPFISRIHPDSLGELTMLLRPPSLMREGPRKVVKEKRGKRKEGREVREKMGGEEMRM